MRQRPVRALHLRGRRRDRRGAQHSQGRARRHGARPRGLRRRDPPGRALERSAERSQSRGHLRHQSPGERPSGRLGEERRRRALPAGVVLQQLRPRRRRHGRRDRRAQPGHRLRAVEGVVGARHRPSGRRRLLPDLFPAGDRLWPLAPPALRHRAEQPGRLGRDQGPDLPEVRRLALAPDRAHRGHLARVHCRPAGADGEGVQRGVQRRPDRAQLPDPRDRRDRGAGRSGLPSGDCVRRRSRQALLSGELREDRARPARVQAAVGCAQGRRAALCRLPLRRSDARGDRGRATSGSATSRC